MVSNEIKKWRLQRGSGGISQAHLARQIRESRSYVNRLERGKRQPNANVMFKVAQYFGCHVEDVFHYVPEAKGLP